jgi:hypothetical protein
VFARFGGLIRPSLAHAFLLKPNLERSGELILVNHQVETVSKFGDVLEPEAGESLNDRFRTGLPPTAERMAAISLIESLVSQWSVNIERIEMAWNRDAAGGIHRLELTVPMFGAYPRVRALSGELLDSSPHIAMHGISFQRPRIGEARIEAQIRLVAYFRD